MIAHKKQLRRRPKAPKWHAPFLRMLPAIRTHARVAFRHLGQEAREEAVQEVIANACRAYVRLVELGKTEISYAGVLARFGVAQVNDGRRVEGRSNVRDVSSEFCQRRKGGTVKRLDKFDKEEGWQEIVVEDKTAIPADFARVRVDFSDWLRTLRRRDRRIAETLSVGETTGDVAKRFHVSASRVSQLRRQLKDSRDEFCGDVAEALSERCCHPCAARHRRPATRARKQRRIVRELARDGQPVAGDRFRRGRARTPGATSG